jgi:hypothetical protein
MSVTKLSWAGMIKLFPPRESLVSDITSGDGKTANLFLQCILLPFHLESREGKPLLIVEAEANGDSRSTSKRGPFICWLVGLVVPVQEILFCIGCFNRPSKIFSSLYTISLHLSLSPSKLGGHWVVVPGRLIISIIICLLRKVDIDTSFKVLAHSLHIESFCFLWHILALLIQSNCL